jgi:uncharacterized repeat protein (TIGR03806 family)
MMVRGQRRGRAHRQSARGGWLSLVVAAAAACGGNDEAMSDPEAADPFARLRVTSARSVTPVQPFLGLSPTAAEASPQRLSETGVFASLETLETVPGIIPFSVQAPLWSDGAIKQRWIAVPSGAQIGFSENESWAFPEGTVLVKHFGMALDERDPESVRRLETRLLVMAEGGGYYGLVYRWDADQRDAQVIWDGADEMLEIIGEDGVPREQRYTYPRANQCGGCHSHERGEVRGARTSQLNGDYDYGEGAGTHNQLAAWSALGVFDRELDETPVDAYPRLVGLEDDSAPVEARVRSYWDGNCSSCHTGEPHYPSWDARFSTPLAEQRLLWADPIDGPRDDGLHLITPGDPERSYIYLRSNSADKPLRMPPVAKNRVDERYVELLREWITALPSP